MSLNWTLNSTFQCIYVVSNTTTSSLEKLCFDLEDDYVLSITKLTQEESSDYLFSKISTSTDMDYLWVLVAGFLVFFMQCGFTMLEAGAVKNINVQNILFKNLMDACIGVIVWWLVGYTVAYGTESDSNGFIGGGDAALHETKAWNAFFFQWAFAATAATIVSGSVAERCSLFAYGIYTVAITAFVYPVIAHWVWDTHGWLSAFNNNPEIDGGVIDFAGSGVVHMVGGWSGLMGAIFLKPRIGRFIDVTKMKSRYTRNLAHEHKFGSSVPLQVLGVFILWFGWYGFNPGSTLAANGAMELASKVTVNTTLGAATGGIVVSLLTLAIEKYWSIPSVVNGILAGLVSITGPCAVVDPGSSIAIGVIGGVFYFAASRFLDHIKVDDPLDAWAVHGVCGVWGVLSVAFFAEPETIAFAGYNDVLINATRGRLFGNQLTAVVMIVVWVVFWIGLLFFTLDSIGLLRVSEEIERRGLDAHEHGGRAVDFKTPKVGKLATDMVARRRVSVEGRELDKEEKENEKKEKENKRIIGNVSPLDTIEEPAQNDNDNNDDERQPMVVKKNEKGIANILADDNDSDDEKHNNNNKQTAKQQQNDL